MHARFAWGLRQFLVYCRGLRDPKGFSRRLSPEESARLAPGSSLWVHAPRERDVIAIAALLESLAEPPRILLTSDTATGRARASRLASVAVVGAAPHDLSEPAGRFLRELKPYAVISLGAEPPLMTLRLASTLGIRACLVDGNLSDAQFRRHRRLSACWRSALETVWRATVRSDDDLERFVRLGLPQEALLAVGDIAHDASPASPAELRRAMEALASAGWNEHVVWVAGGVRPLEEEALVSAFLVARARVPALRLVLAPERPARARELSQRLARAGVEHATLSEPRASPLCLLIDEPMRLGGFYASGDFAFAGGTLASARGQDFLEPALAAVPVLFGPHAAPDSPAEALAEHGGGFRVADRAALADAAVRLATDAHAREEAGRLAVEFARSLAGAVRRTAQHLGPILRAP